MSRIGKLPITIPNGVKVAVREDNTVVVKGPKGEMTQQVDPNIKVEVDKDAITLKRSSDDKEQRALHGLYRSLINNMVVGVSEGFRKELEVVGVGYRVSNTGQNLE